MAFCSWVEEIKLRPKRWVFNEKPCLKHAEPREEKLSCFVLFPFKSELSPHTQCGWTAMAMFFGWDSGTEIELSTRFGLSPSLYSRPFYFLTLACYFNAIET